MLVLSRRNGEAVLIGKTRVTIIDTRNGRVRLGFDGEDTVRRAELDDEPTTIDAGETATSVG